MRRFSLLLAALIGLSTAPSYAKAKPEPRKAAAVMPAKAAKAGTPKSAKPSKGDRAAAPATPAAKATKGKAAGKDKLAPKGQAVVDAGEEVPRTGKKKSAAGKVLAKTAPVAAVAAVAAPVATVVAATEPVKRAAEPAQPAVARQELKTPPTAVYYSSDEKAGPAPATRPLTPAEMAVRMARFAVDYNAAGVQPPAR